MNRNLLLLFTLVIQTITSCISDTSSNKHDPFTPHKYEVTQKSDTTNINIVLVPFSNRNLKPFDNALFDTLIKGIKSMYSANLRIEKEIALPLDAYYKPRNRYIADSLLLFLDQLHTNKSDFYLGLTEEDISTEKGDVKNWGIFGLSWVGRPSSVISTFRLKRNADKELLIRRLIKVANHELGHAFGLLHCPTPHCLMEDGMGTIKTVDAEDGRVCSICTKKLRSVLLRPEKNSFPANQ